MNKTRWTKNLAGTKYSRRVKREATFEPSEPLQFLSGNKKTGVSINLPLTNCRPSIRCAETCYAMEGFIAAGNSIRRTLAVDRLFRTGEGMDRLIEECKQQDNVRLNGIGDFVTEHIVQLYRLAWACPDTIFWGFTRKQEIARMVNGTSYDNLSIILSWDASHRAGHVKGYKGPLAYGPVKPEDKIPDDPRIIVVFPEHHGRGPTGNVEPHKKDCPAVRTTNPDLKYDACGRCRRCFKPHDVKDFDTSRFYEALV